MERVVVRRKSPKKSSLLQPDENLLSIHRFAERSDMSVPWLRKKVRSREIAHVKIGRRILIPESELHKLVAQGYVPALKEAQ